MGVTAYNILHETVYRARDLVKGTGIYRHLERLGREQFLEPAELESLQEQRLRRILLMAAKHSPYYRELFTKHCIDVTDRFGISQLQMIPLFRREDLQANLDRITCDNARGLMPNASGGSTGNPVNFYQDQNYWNFSDAAGIFFESWMGINSGDKTAILWGSDRDFKNIPLKKRMWMKFDRERLLNSFSMSEEAIRDFINKINLFKPRYIYGYAGSLHLISRIINNTRPLDFVPAAVRSSAETLHGFQREEIEKAFGTRVYDFYGSREVNNLASECGAHDGLHILSSARIVEIVDDNGSPLPDGTLGQVAVTDLTNMVFPFIRYLNGDLAIKSRRQCSCGRCYPMLEKIQGRTTDMIIINGQYIHGEFFTHLFYRRPEIRQFQVIQEDPETLRILVVASDRETSLDDVIGNIRQKVGQDINIILNFVDTIATTNSGKFRFTISRLDKNVASARP